MSQKTSLEGRTVTFAGKFKVARDTVKAEAEAAGCRITGAVSGSTDILVLGAGVEVWTEDQFRATLLSAVGGGGCGWGGGGGGKKGAGKRAADAGSKGPPAKKAKDRAVAGAAGAGTKVKKGHLREQLREAVESGNATEVRTLLVQGADMDTPGADGVTPAQEAASCNHCEVGTYASGTTCVACRAGKSDHDSSPATPCVLTSAVELDVELSSQEKGLSKCASMSGDKSYCCATVGCGFSHSCLTTAAIAGYQVTDECVGVPKAAIAEAPCTPGTELSGMGGCRPCLPGYVDIDADPATPCTACSAGHSAYEAISCRPCKSGNVDHDADPATPCKACSTGSYTLDTPAGSTKCLLCPAGYSCPAGSDKLPCDSTKYSDSVGETSRIDAALAHVIQGANESTLAEGFECRQCPDGSVVVKRAAVATEIGVFSTTPISFTSIALGSHDTPFVAYCDDANGDRVSLKQFANGRWTSIDVVDGEEVCLFFFSSYRQDNLL